MLRLIIYFVIFFLAATLQTVLSPQIAIHGAQPSFLLIFTVIIALRHGALAGCLVGFLSGLLCDVYAPIEWLGAYSFSYCVVGFVVGQIEESFINLNLLLKIALLFAVELLKDLLYFIAIGKSGDEVLYSIAFISFKNSIYTICFGAIFFYLTSLGGTEKKVEMYGSRGI
jgi:rod shape-determining protein MreD